jgi:Flp pilus assembly protein TadD
MKTTRACLATLILVAMGCSSSPPKNETNDNGATEASDAPAPAPVKVSSSPESTKRSASRENKAARPLNANSSRLSAAKQSGNEDDMKAAASAALTSNANDVVALNALAMHYLRKGHVALAKTLLQRAYVGHEKSASLRNNLGLIYLAEGDLQSAILTFKEALSLDSHLASAAANLGSIYAKYGDYDRALPLLEIAYRANISDLGVANDLAVCLGVKGDRKRAEEIYDKMLGQEPQNTNTLYNYAILLVDYENKAREGTAILNRLKLIGVPSEMAERVAQLDRKIAEAAKH